MKVPINLPILNEKEVSEVTKAIQKGMLTSASFDGGKNVQEFEKSISNFVKCKFAVAVNSGTSALQAALLALEIKPNDEVLIPSFSFVATANAVLSVGAKPVFVDISRENYTLDVNDLKKKITKKSKVIIPVHLYGNIASMEEIIEFANKKDIKIIEDAAQSLGSVKNKKHSGTFSEMGCYSLYPGKVMTSGEGGCIVTENKNLKDKLKMIRNHGMVHGYDTKIFGLNLRMPEVCAAIGKVQLKKLPQFLKVRKINAKLLTEQLSGLPLKIPKEQKNEQVNWYLYTVESSNRDSLLKSLNQKGFGAAVYYKTPIHRLPFFNLKLKLPVTEECAKKVLSLPIQPLVSQENIISMAKIIKRNLKNE